MKCIAGIWLITAILLCLSTTSSADDRPPRPIPPGADARERFLKLIDRPRVPLRATERAGAVVDGLEEIGFAFDAEATQRVPGLLVKPAAKPGPLPAVIVLHGTGGSKQGLKPLLRKLAEQGLISVAIDGRYAGERSGGAQGSDAYRAAIFESWRTGTGFPFFYDTVWDVLRLVDYLETRPDVDRKRIGAIGFSKGGIELYLAAAADPRLAVAVPCIGVQSFGWALENDAWQSRIDTIRSAADQAAAEAGVGTLDAPFVRRFYERVVPGIHQEFDGPAMLPLIAPRPLLVINGEQDNRTPLPGLKQCVDAARSAYDRSGAADRFEFLLQPATGHSVTPAAERKAIDWLVKNLKS